MAMLAMRCVLFSLACWCVAGEPSDSTCTAASQELCDGEQDMPRDMPDAADGSSLMQMQARQKHAAELAQQFPDLGAQWEKATDWIHNVTGKAQKSATDAEAALSSGMATAMASLGDLLNKTLALLASQTKTLQTTIMQAKGGVTSGVASLLKRSTNASVVKVPVGEKYEAELNATLAATTTAWSAVQTSVNSTLETISAGLKTAGLEKVAAAFSSAMQEFLTTGNAFIAKLQDFKSSLGGSGNGTALLQSEPFKSFVATANAKLQEASAYAKSFPAIFMDAFQRLQDQVLTSMKRVLNEQSLAKVQAAFNRANGQAKAVADSLADASSALIQNIQEGLDAAKPPPVPGAAVRLGVAAPVALSLSLFALLSV